jgi:diguanylate cyclase (GGDEF)-like protein
LLNQDISTISDSLSIIKQCCLYFNTDELYYEYKMMSEDENRPLRIGILINQLEVKYMHLIWQAVQRSAKEMHISVLAFVGKALKAPYGNDIEQNFVYSFINDETVDGLIAIPSVGAFVSTQDYQMFVSHLSKLPLVSLSVKCNNTPTVFVDCKQGMMQAVEHCIVDHNYKRIAFIRGPVESIEAENRFLAYKETLKKHKIAYNPAVVVQGDFVIISGRRAARELLQKRKQKVDVIIAANDDMALGAIEVIQELGLKVPDDIAVIGFDDWEEAECHLPSISSVRQPLQQQVHEALKMLIAMIQGKSKREDIVLPTQLIKRSSCGCPTQARYIRYEIKGDENKALSAATTVQKRLDAIQNFIMDAYKEKEKYNRQILPLVELFFKVLSRFLTSQLKKKEAVRAFSEIIRESYWMYNNIRLWQEMIFSVQQNVGRILTDPKAIGAFHDLFFEFNLMMTGFLESKQAVKRFALETKTIDLLAVSQSLIASFNFEGLLNIITQQLPTLGIKSCYIFLFEEPITPISEYFWDISGTVKILLALKDGSSTRHSGSIFPAGMVIPYILTYEDSKKDWILMPLVFAAEHFGVILMEAGSKEEIVYETLRMQISSAIKGAILFEQQKKIEDELKKSNIELESLSLLDELTGLYNRRGFMTLSTQIWKMAQRSNMRFLIVFMDLDELKKINDNYGHSEGDGALKAFAEILKIAFRRNDVLSRIGGDEFVVLSYNASLEHRDNIQERIQKNISHYNNTSGKSYKLSVSIGFACFESRSTITVDELIKKADKELYISKYKKKKSNS